MASRFLDLEAQRADSDSSSDDELGFGEDLDADQDLIDDQDAEPASPFAYASSVGPMMNVANPPSNFLDHLERRYVTSSTLGKRKAAEPEARHPVLRLANRPEIPASIPVSFSSSQPQPIHPMTKTRLPRPEQPIRVPEERRVMRASEWIDAPPSNILPDRLKQSGSSKGERRRMKLEKWSRWAKNREREREYAPGQWVEIRRGSYKGDPAQVFKMQTRERSDEEVASEKQMVEEALARGEEPPPQSPELVLEGYWVLIVPRLPPPTLTRRRSLVLKQKQPRGSPRFERWVFHPRDYGLHIPKQDREQVAGFEVDGRIFSHVLLLKLFKVHALQPLSTIDAATVAAFKEHPFSKPFPFPLPNEWAFCNGEEVDVTEREGHAEGRGILQLSGAELCVEMNHHSSLALYPVTKDRLKKVIDIGNYVKVLGGGMTGREGLVVERRDDILGISEYGTCTGISFFVHLNCVSRTSGSNISGIPWLEKEVIIMKGPYSRHTGIVKDVKRKPNRGVLFLWLFVAALGKAVEIEDDRVVVKATRDTSRTPLWKFYPLGPEQRQYHIDRTIQMDVDEQISTGLATSEDIEDGLVRNQKVESEVVIRTVTGRPPWIGIFVGITHGPHKSYEGVVVDVNRCSKPNCQSGLMVEIELNVMGNRRVQVLYDHVRERRTGLTLAGYHPVTPRQRFFAPKPTFSGIPARWNRRATLLAGVLDTSDPSPLLSPPLPPTSPTLSLVPSLLQTDIDGLSLPPILPLDALPMDVWNPYYDYDGGWSYPGDIDPPVNALSPSSAPDCDTNLTSTSSAMATTTESSHWLSCSELVGILILVDIVDGPYKKKNAYVEPTRTANGPIIARTRKGKGNRFHDVALQYIVKASKDPGRSQRNDDPLLVVTSGQHIGKLVRRIHHFFVQAPIPANKWFILAVFHPQNVLSGLTGELVECSLDELVFVEEKYTDSCSAAAGVMKELHDAAKLQLRNVDVRAPGEGNLTDIRTVLQAKSSASSILHV
ncbi:hypothetical protein V5O48_010216 [Marasmius crinis-equi]|uniref:KOW domain-containing protein n=1 Tax=Marasmius crinis-equi TaxID=585013 RepID=A0ABR3F916_9AGAR